MKKILLILLSLTGCIFLTAQPQLRFQNFNTRDGLSHYQLGSLFIDSREQQAILDELKETLKIQDTRIIEQGLHINSLQFHADEQKRIIEILMKEMEAIKRNLK